MEMNEQTHNGRLLPLMEQFISVQGEGFQAGMPACFVRLGGCDVGCFWCDVKESWDPLIHPLTDTDSIINDIIHSGMDSLVVTGGEPLNHNLDYFTKRLKELKPGIKTFLETSGTAPFSGTWNWICLSPKAQQDALPVYFEKADELKIVVLDENDLKRAEQLAEKVNPECHLMLQPEWKRFNTAKGLIVDYILKNPKWRISLQIHKFLRIP
ncbi:MAG: 7-carboxy-7-deazaguanine synthase QueE [Bacteroidota bacterium]